MPVRQTARVDDAHYPAAPRRSWSASGDECAPAHQHRASFDVTSSSAGENAAGGIRREFAKSLAGWSLFASLQAGGDGRTPAEVNKKKGGLEAPGGALWLSQWLLLAGMVALGIVEGLRLEKVGATGALLAVVAPLQMWAPVAYIATLYLRRLWTVARQDAWDSRLLRALGFRPRPVSPGAWTLAVSPHVLLDSCRSLQAETWVNCVSWASVSAAFAVSATQSALTPEEAAFMRAVCGPQRNTCTRTFSALWPMVALDLGMGMMMMAIQFGTPLDAWSPVVKRGLRSMGAATFATRTLLRLPWLTIPGFSLDIALLVGHLALPLLPLSMASSAAVYALMALAIAELLYIMGTLACMLAPITTPEWMAAGASARSEDIACGRSYLAVLWNRVTGLLRCVDSSARHRRSIILYIGIMTWSIGLHTPARDAVLHTTFTWSMRLAALLAIAATHDVVVDHARLEREGEVGFGLVVRAAHLRAALEAHLAGTGGYRGPLHTHKATIWRMQHTLMVSYRWQWGHGVHLKEGVPPLNMSTWQMATLARALRSSRATYVWIDCLSVPQSPGRVQQRLLARMMAVYASSPVGTVVLRSLEREGERYHQRAWTMQEFATSCSLSIHNQPPPAVSRLNSTAEGSQPEHTAPLPKATVTAAEETMLVMVREWHQRRLQTCVPYWLCKDDAGRFDDGNALRAAVRKYDKLQRHVHCTVEPDKLRALFQLVTNSPVEGQSELVKLVKRVYGGIGHVTPPLLRALELSGSASLAANLKRYRVVGQAWVEEPDVSPSVRDGGVPLSTAGGGEDEDAQARARLSDALT